MDQAEKEYGLKLGEFSCLCVVGMQLCNILKQYKAGDFIPYEEINSFYENNLSTRKEAAWQYLQSHSDKNPEGSDTTVDASNSSVGSATTTEQVENFINNPIQGL